VGDGCGRICEFDERDLERSPGAADIQVLQLPRHAGPLLIGGEDEESVIIRDRTQLVELQIDDLAGIVLAD